VGIGLREIFEHRSHYLCANRVAEPGSWARPLAHVLLVLGVIALLLPRKWVPVRTKRWILAALIAAGILQIVDGVFYLASHGGASMMLYGISEVLMFGPAFLMLTETRWKKVVGILLIVLGLYLFLMTTASALRNTAVSYL